MSVISVSVGPDGSADESLNNMGGAPVSGVSRGGVTRVEVGAPPAAAPEGDHAGILATATDRSGNRVHPGSLTKDTLVNVDGITTTLEVAMAQGLVPNTVLRDQGAAPQGSPQQNNQQQQQSNEQHEAALRQQQEDAQARLPGNGEEVFHTLNDTLGQDTLVTVGADVVMGMVYPDANSTLSPDDLAEVARGRGVDATSGQIGQAITQVMGGIADKAHAAVAGVFSLKPTEDDLSPVYDLMRKDPDRMRDALMHLFLARSTDKLVSYAKQIKQTMRIDESGNLTFDHTVIR